MFTMASTRGKLCGAMFAGERRRSARWRGDDPVFRADAILFSEAIAAEGAIVFAKACELGLEGIVSKRLGGLYWSCRNWVKVKNPAFQRRPVERATASRYLTAISAPQAA